MDYAHRVVIITGASSGIGKRIALDFAARGATAVLVARRKELLHEIAGECRRLGGEAMALEGDLSDRAFVDSVIPSAAGQFGRVDILINNAGIPKHKQIYAVTPEDVDETLRVNFLAAAYLTLAAIPVMLCRREGYIVNISSAAGRMASARGTIYAASKFALTGFSEGLALDLAGSNIHVAVIHPGAIDTPIWQKAALEEAILFHGRKYPPELVSRAVFRCIEKKEHEATLPPRVRAVVAFKTMFPNRFRRRVIRSEPVPADVIEKARERAQRLLASRSASPA